MAISYEEALQTLQSMFGDQWTRQHLDFVLRHQKGHMENTVDLILRHGAGDPQGLVDKLKSGVDPDAEARDRDEQLARQLAQGQERQQQQQVAGGRRNRGTPTKLPGDFLRIPNAPATPQSLVDDEALARMLQDELFSEELARNPDFAHLARGRPRTSGGMPTGRIPAVPRGAQSQQRTPGPPPIDVPAIMGKISELGDNARSRLQMLAAQFNAKNTSSPPAAERRGLLDDDTDDMELAARKDL